MSLGSSRPRFFSISSSFNLSKNFLRFFFTKMDRGNHYLPNKTWFIKIEHICCQKSNFLEKKSRFHKIKFHVESSKLWFFSGIKKLKWYALNWDLVCWNRLRLLGNIWHWVLFWSNSLKKVFFQWNEKFCEHTQTIWISFISVARPYIWSIKDPCTLIYNLLILIILVLYISTS